jgi:hypothetical protein
MCGNALRQRFPAFPDHEHLPFCPSHNERVMILDALRSDDGWQAQNRPPPSVLFQPFWPAERRRCMPRVLCVSPRAKAVPTSAHPAK